MAARDEADDRSSLGTDLILRSANGASRRTLQPARTVHDNWSILRGPAEAGRLSIATAASGAAAEPSPAAERPYEPPSTWPRWSPAEPIPSSPPTIKSFAPLGNPASRPSSPASESSSSSSTPSCETENHGPSRLDNQDSRSRRTGVRAKAATPLQAKLPSPPKAGVGKASR